jgi:NitT/TauT family transport system permease protein
MDEGSMETKSITATTYRYLPVLSLVVAVVVWEIVARIIAATVPNGEQKVPAFTAVVAAFFELAGRLPMDLATSLMHFGIGLGAALAIGIPLGIATGWYRGVDRAANPLIEILRPIPPLAWIPFAIIWIGLNPQSAGFIIFVGAFFPVLTNTYAGFKSVPRIFVEAAKVLGCTNQKDLIRYVAFPSAVPSIATGIRVAMGVGWMCLVAAELFVGGKYGLGRQLWHSYSLYATADIVVYMVILGVLGLLIDMIFRHYVDRRLLRWREGEVI